MEIFIIWVNINLYNTIKNLIAMKLPVLLKCITFITLLQLLSFCAEKSSGEMKSIVNNSPGLWIGMWEGFILPFSLLGKIFNLNIGIHESHNSGAIYWIGYLIGFILFMKSVMFLTVNENKR